MGETSADAIFRARAIRALKRRYSDIVVGPEVIPGLTLSYSAAFTGRFRGNHKFWLVGAWPGILGFTPEQINNLSDSIKNIHASFAGIPHDNLDTGVIIVMSTTPRPGLQSPFSRFRVPVELIDLEELEDETIFGDVANDYPGSLIHIGHNSREYREALGAIDEVIGELSSSSSLELHADARDRLVVEMEAGRTLLEATTVRLPAMQNTILPALNFIVTACASAALGELAKVAIKKLVALLFGS